MSVSQESPSEEVGPIPIITVEPSPREVLVKLNESIANLKKRQEKYLEILKKIETQDTTHRFSWLFGQTVQAYDDLRILYVYVTALWGMFERQVELDNHISRRVESTRGEQERFREQLPANLGELVQKGFDELTQKTQAQTQRKLESYVA